MKTDLIKKSVAKVLAISMLAMFEPNFHYRLKKIHLVFRVLS